MIIKAFRYIFYRIYIFLFKRWGYPNPPAIATVGIMLILISYNMVTVDNISEIMFGMWLLPDKITPDQRLKFDLTGTIILMIITDFYILKRIPKIIREFKNETMAQRNQRSIYFWTYILGTFILFITSMILAAYSHHKGFTVINYFRENINH